MTRPYMGQSSARDSGEGEFGGIYRRKFLFENSDWTKNFSFDGRSEVGDVEEQVLGKVGL